MNENRLLKEVKMLEEDEKSSWSIQDFKQSFATVLSDPTVREKIDLLSRDWGSSFTSPTIPYISYPHITFKSSVFSPAFLLQEEFKFFLSNCLNNEFSRKEQEINLSAALSDIPEVFFREDYNVNALETFEFLISGAGILHSDNRFDSLSSFSEWLQFLQKNYGLVLDRVEQLLASQISSRSEEIFQLLDSFRELTSNISSTCLQMSTIRNHLRKVDEKLTYPGFQLFKLLRKKKNLELLHEKLKVVSTVRSTQKTIKELLSSADYVGALNLISTANQIINHDLKGVQSFKDLSVQLSEMETFIHKLIETEFIRISVELSTECSRTIQEDDKAILQPYVNGLIRLKKTEFRPQFERSLVAAVKTKMKIITQNFLNSNKKSSKILKLSRAVEEMNSELFVAFLISLSEHMDTLICNVKTVRFLLEDLFPQPLEMPRGHRSHVSVDDNSNFFFPRKKFRERNLKKMVNSENDVIGLPQITRQTSLVGECQSESDASISDDFSGDILVDLLKPDGEEMINNIIELIHKRIAKLLKSRTPDILKVPYNQAAELYERVATFVERSTSRGSLSSPVRRELLSLLRLYFEQFHSKRMTQLSSSLDNEVWKRAHVAYDFQLLVDAFKKIEDPAVDFYESLNFSSQKKRLDPAESASHYLVVNEQRFAVTGSLLMFLKLLSEYSKCSKDFRIITLEVLNGLIEILKLYNSKSYDLILSAEVVSLKILKKVTAKHIALSSESLQVILLQLPLLKSLLSKRLSTKHLLFLSEFDSISLDYLNHIEKLIQKIVNIMEDVLFHQWNTKQVSWEKVPTDSASDYMKGIIEQTIRLNKVLKNLLDPSRQNVILSRIYIMYSKQLQSFYEKLNFSENNVQKRIQMDVRFFYKEFKKIADIKEYPKDLKLFVTQKINEANNI